MRFIDFSNMPIAKINKNNIVSMEEAITAYRNGARVGVISNSYGSLYGDGVIAMDKDAVFTTDFDYLINCQWVILN